MPPLRRDYSAHVIEWDPANRKIVVTPKYPDRSVRPFFIGLGNAKIKINYDHPPTRIVQSITGDTDSDALLPTSPYKLRRWRALVGDVQSQTRDLPTYNAGVKRITYQEAGQLQLQEVASCDIAQNGYAVVGFGNYERIEQ